VGDRVDPDPLPALGLSERGVQDAMDAAHRSRRETVTAEIAVERVDPLGSQLSNHYVTETRLEVVAHNALDLALGRRRPIW